VRAVAPNAWVHHWVNERFDHWRSRPEPAHEHRHHGAKHGADRLPVDPRAKDRAVLRAVIDEIDRQETTQ
jgi:hypothetical protein